MSLECFSGWNWDDFALWPVLHFMTDRACESCGGGVHSWTLHFGFLGFYFAVRIHRHDEA